MEIFVRLQQYKLVEMKLLAQQRELQVPLLVPLCKPFVFISTQNVLMSCLVMQICYVIWDEEYYSAD